MPSPSYMPVIRTATPGDFNIGGVIQSTRTIATDVVLAAIIGPGDAGDRFRLYADGKMEWGSGATNRDATISRTAPATLNTTGFFGMGSGQSNNAFSVFGAGAAALKIGTVGGGIGIKEGANARMGTVALVAGTATVAHTGVTALTRIFLTSQTDGGTPGFLRVSATVVGTSFTITSGSAADTSTVAYLMVEAS